MAKHKLRNVARRPGRHLVDPLVIDSARLTLTLRARRGERFPILPVADPVKVRPQRLILLGALDFAAFGYLALILVR